VQTPARERKGEKAKSDADKENQEDKEGNEATVDEETGRKMKRSASRRRRKGKEGDAEKEEQEEKPVDQAKGKLVPSTTDVRALSAPHPPYAVRASGQPRKRKQAWLGTRSRFYLVLTDRVMGLAVGVCVCVCGRSRRRTS
jgi:hypothetical protein